MPEPKKKLSVTDFAALVRSETGAFQDVPDAELVEQFIERFPAYRSVVEMSATETLARAEPAPQAAEPEGVSRLVTLAGAAFNRGLASPVTALIDLASKATDPISKAIGLPEAELLGGSQQVERLIGENIGQATPQNPLEQFLSTVAGEAGAGVLPGLGILGLAGRAAKAAPLLPVATQGVRGLLGETSRQIAGAPGRALATEAGAALGAGVGRAGTEQLAPESPTLQTVGALAGGLTGGIGTGLATGLGRPRRPLQGPPAAFEQEAFTRVPPRPRPEPEIPEFPIYARPDSAARLAAEKEQFGSLVPRRIFGAEPQRFPTLPRKLAQAEEARLSLEKTRRQEVFDAAIQAGKTERQAQRAAKKIQVSILPLADEQFAIEARIAAEQHDDTVRALRSQRGIDPAKVEAERLKDITPEPVARPKDIDVERLLAAPEAPLAPAGTPQALTQQIRAARAATSPVLPGELPPGAIPMARILPLVEQAGVDPEHFAGVMQNRFGRAHFNTPNEFREMAGALKNISRKPVVIDPDILEASPYWDIIEPIERVQLAARAGVRNFLGTGTIRIAKMGPVGRQLAQMIDDVEVVSGMRGGKASDEIIRFRETFGKNPSAKENFFQSLHKGAPAQEGSVADAVSRVQARMDQIYDEAALLDLQERSSSGALKPIQRRSPYLPNFVKIDVFRTAAAQRRFVKDMEKVLAGEGVPAEDIKNRVNSYLLSRHPKVAIDPHLERARELNVPDKWLETDPFKVMLLYYPKAFRRLEQARIFGPNNEKGFELISQIENLADRQFALDIFRRFAGVHEGSRDLSLIVEWMRGYQSATKLSFGTTLLNIWQPVIQGAIRTNVKSVFRGFKDILGEARRESRHLAIRAGSVQDDVIHEAAQAAGGGGRISSWLVRNVYLFNGSEINNRFWGSAIGKHYSRDMAAKLMKNPSNTVARRELKRFNVDPDEVLANGGQLTEDNILLAAQRGSEDINYRFRPQDNPAFANHPIGKLWFQFRNFSLNTAKLITRELGQQTLRSLDNKEEAARAVAQWAKFVSLSPFVGLAQVVSSKTLRRVGMALVFGKVVLSPEEQQIASLAIEWSLATVTGLYYDALSSMRYGEHGVMGLLGGAAFGTAVEGITVLGKSPEAKARFAAKQIPQIGKFVPPARRGRKGTATGVGELKGIQ